MDRSRQWLLVHLGPRFNFKTYLKSKRPREPDGLKTELISDLFIGKNYLVQLPQKFGYLTHQDLFPVVFLYSKSNSVLIKKRCNIEKRKNLICVLSFCLQVFGSQ